MRSDVEKPTAYIHPLYKDTLFPYVSAEDSYINWRL
jgi:hypothetical protein